MSDFDYYGYYGYGSPIETDEGIKAKSRRGSFAQNWWAKRWIDSLEQIVDAGRLSRGRSYARKGQVLSIEEHDSTIVALVQGSTPRPYRVEITLETLSDVQWERVIEALADQALYTAQLLAGEMPREIEDVFDTVGVSLLPRHRDELLTECSCPDFSNPCKHIAATHYILGERFDQDPFLIFRLRGRSEEQLLEALRARRAASSATLSPAPETSESIIPLDESLDSFWEMGPELAHFRATIEPPSTPLPLLKRLGQPDFLEGSIESLLGPAYQAMMEAALEAAYGSAEGENGV